MKAKEYFEKYDRLIVTDSREDSAKEAVNLFTELNSEAKDIIEKRGVKTMKAFTSVLKELNQKWNAIAALFEKKYGTEILTRNAYLSYLEEKNAGIKF